MIFITQGKTLQVIDIFLCNIVPLFVIWIEIELTIPYNTFENIPIDCY